MTKLRHTFEGVIRPASPADIPGIFRVRTSVRENRASVERLAALGITASSLAEMIATGSHGCWCADDGGQIAAFSMSDRENGLVEALFVHPEFERLGLGQNLLDRAVTDLEERGFTRIRLYTAPGSGAFDFYRKRGWKPSGRMKRDDTELVWTHDAV